MECLFCGVGEAFDHDQLNTSLLVSRAGTIGVQSQSVLLDCGFTAAASFFRHAPWPKELDAVFISHFHGDHFLGLPFLLGRLIEEGRTKQLVIIGQKGVAELVTGLMETAYPNFLSKADFPLLFKEVAAGSHVQVADMDLRFALGDHGLPCLAVRVETHGNALFYSGDGRPTDETAELAKGCGLVVHEAFSMEKDHPGHGTVDQAMFFARNAGAQTLALVHIRRDIRHSVQERILKRQDAWSLPRISIPESGAVYIF